MNPLISIIIPTFNRGNLISETIDSLRFQTYKNIEIIIVDDHSDDNTEIIVNDFIKIDHRIQFYKRPLSKPKGANSCRNYGFQISNGDYVKWIDSDDLLSQDAIEKQLISLIHSGASLSICRTKKFRIIDDLKNGNCKEWGNIQKSITPDNYILNGVQWSTMSGLWNRKWFNVSLIWDEEIMNSQEWLMHFTQLCSGISIVSIDEYLAYARTHDNSMGNVNNKKGLYYYNNCLARLKAINITKSNNQISKKVLKILAKQFCWYFLFIFYKGSPLKGFTLFNRYLYCLYILIK